MRTLCLQEALPQDAMRRLGTPMHYRISIVAAIYQIALAFLVGATSVPMHAFNRIYYQVRVIPLINRSAPSIRQSILAHSSFHVCAHPGASESLCQMPRQC